MELVRHMTSVPGYARTFFIGGQYWPDPLSSLQEELDRFHEMVQDLANHLEAGTLLLQSRVQNGYFKAHCPMQ